MSSTKEQLFIVSIPYMKQIDAVALCYIFAKHWLIYTLLRVYYLAHRILTQSAFLKYSQKKLNPRGQPTWYLG